MIYLSIPRLDFSWVLIFILFVFLTAGCGTVHKSLDSGLANFSNNVTVLSKIPREEISIRIEEKRYTTTGAGDGLIWLWIDKGINKARGKAAEERIAPLLEATADIDFRTQYWDELEKALSQSSWIKVAHLDKRGLGYTEEEAAKIELPFLALSTSYELSPNSQVLVVQTKANLYLKDHKKPDYFGFHSYYSPKIGKNNEKGKNAIALWAANNASVYREALSEGINQNMKMLQIDLFDRPANPMNEIGEKIKIRFRSPISGSMQTLRGIVLKRDGNRIIMREKGGNLFSIAKSLEK